ncbi:hypothetical protein S40288_06837 [Stachybotrys chartarum IBT 40288]|nr:hypothetical protein S40288_06837 [Stachybotrys chartarum IBT 40288]
MRLINVQSLELEEFSGSSTPPYAVLSHTWGEKEASYGEWIQRRTRLMRLRRPGLSKVFAMCKQARTDGIQYAWVDTVCIDKSSSAELSEAINSMFAWYTRAKVCYVFLRDVNHHTPGGGDFSTSFQSSRWFTRGWTLQELIAPRNVIFYSAEWKVIGTKSTMAVQLARITGIDRMCLQRERRLDEYSIAQRMAWAASRSTTRDEDMAYCLLGLFNIAMPLLYGEGGQRAFRRLQEEIIKSSDDHSILTFDTNLSNNTLFADHPNTFARGPRIHTNFTRKITAPFSITNAGLSMTTPLIQTLSPFWVLAVLNCVEMDVDRDAKRAQICLPLFGKDHKYMRARSPVCLISRPLDDGGIGIQDEIPDLGPQVECTYLISSFPKIYSAYGTEMDTALKGFEADPSPAAGFMITLPRGLGSYRINRAHPANALRPDISFFTPPMDQLSQFSGGLIVFKDSNVTPPRQVALYLGLELNSSKQFLLDWVCRLVEVEAEVSAESVKQTAEILQRQHERGLFGNSRKHYHHLGDSIAAARTRFPTLTGEPSKEVIMVEVVFEAQSILEEWDDLDFNT